MISREQARENTRKQLAREDLIWYYQDKEHNARTGHRGLAYEFVWRLLKHREVFEAVEILQRAQQETTIRGIPLSTQEKKDVNAIYRKALREIEQEKLA